MNIVPARPLIVLGALALAASACGGARPAAPLDVHQRFEAAGLPPVDVRFSIQPEHRRAQQRYVRAAMATLKSIGEWLGPFPRQSLTIVDPPWGGSPAADADDVIVLERTSWWSTTSSMTPELATARAVSRRFWTILVDTQALPPWFVDGLAEYAARRVVSWLFEQEHLPPGYAFVEQRYVDRFVPLRLRIRLLPANDGDPIPAYRADPMVGGMPGPRRAAEERSLEAKTVLTLGTLERWVGRPVFDQLVAEFVRESRSGRPTIADFVRTATDVSGQDLSWLLAQAFGSPATFDYAVDRLDSEPEADGSYRTTVVARRLGDGRFTGTSALPVGPFERGRGVMLLVTFADGSTRVDYWDGRDLSKTFVYRSPARGTSAQVDPGRTLLLDVNTTNNSRTFAPRTSVAATIWASRWLLWLQDLLLTYASLV